MRFRLAFAVVGILIVGTTRSLAAEAVLYVGCGGTQQGEFWPAPTGGGPVALPFTHRLAQELAVFRGRQGAILGPRDWTCSSIQGTDIGTLYIVPKRRNNAIAAQIVLAPIVAETDGMQDAAFAFVRRYFRSSKLWNSKNDSKKPFFFVPRYPDDVVMYRSDRVFEFVTPPRRLGLGTDELYRYKGESRDPFSGPHRFSVPTYGVLRLVNHGIILVTIRLPPKLEYLHSVIIRNFERCMSDTGRVMPFKECIPNSSPFEEGELR
jgi:hypothetical protein